MSYLNLLLQSDGLFVILYETRIVTSQTRNVVISYILLQSQAQITVSLLWNIVRVMVISQHSDSFLCDLGVIFRRAAYDRLSDCLNVAFIPSSGLNN